MKIKYCWRCEMEVAMLTDEELNLCHRAIDEGKNLVENEIEHRNIENYTWFDKIETFERFRYFLEMYRVITGQIETNPNAIWHHRINQYGKDCPNCSKPLRTNSAKFCAACGFGKEDLNTDSRPLIEKRKELF